MSDVTVCLRCIKKIQHKAVQKNIVMKQNT